MITVPDCMLQLLFYEIHLPRVIHLRTRFHFAMAAQAQKTTKTYNSRYSLTVTHLNTLPNMQQRDYIITNAIIQNVLVSMVS